MSYRYVTRNYVFNFINKEYLIRNLREFVEYLEINPAYPHTDITFESYLLIIEATTLISERNNRLGIESIEYFSSNIEQNTRIISTDFTSPEQMVDSTGVQMINISGSTTDNNNQSYYIPLQNEINFYQEKFYQTFNISDLLKDEKKEKNKEKINRFELMEFE